MFGYEGNSNDLKVVETGGEFFIVIPSVYTNWLLMTLYGNVVLVRERITPLLVIPH